MDLSSASLATLSARASAQSGSPATATLGNALGVRTFCGDATTLPDYLLQGSQAVLLVSALPHLFDAKRTLTRLAILLRPGAHVLIAEPAGRPAAAARAAATPATVRGGLPTRAELDALLADLPFEVIAFEDAPDEYHALLRVPTLFARPGLPRLLRGPVVTGFQRGSRQLGVPTANIDPAVLGDRVADLPRGVYYGWAQLAGGAGRPAADGAVRGMVMNVGRRPTVEDAGDVTVEVHVLGGEFSSDFYGETLSAVPIGFLRPELKFSGIGELLAQIKADIALAKNLLAEEGAQASRSLLE